ncbi:uncharacterized protein V1516DRAFT_679511 [Lipomyces oligophaga]|uniref:uncharacterized protein n=1 Tax=Lipomyces oligophaga TaxID=45792 RepID=UPI0034CF03BE
MSRCCLYAFRSSVRCFGTAASVKHSGPAAIRFLSYTRQALNDNGFKWSNISVEYGSNTSKQTPRKNKSKNGRQPERAPTKNLQPKVSQTESPQSARTKSEKIVDSVVPSVPKLPAFISLSNLAQYLDIKPAEFLDALVDLGFENLSYDHIFDFETASSILLEFGLESSESSFEDIVAAPPPSDLSTVPLRPPFVTIMGHVDHGKTTILDFLRKSSIVQSESGGITQHIGAFSVPLSTGQRITFLDTPGHAAFLKMRQRGANITDIVVLVVAADDSVMPQTIEAIKHANSAAVPLIVAINKIDKPEANPETVCRDLSEHGIFVEQFGGDIQAIPVSGLTGQGMPDLEEAIITLAEMLDIRAEYEDPCEGWIVESELKKGRGFVATVVIRRGTLKPGMSVVAGVTFAKVRSLRDEFGKQIKAAKPGQPVEIDGWKALPEAGDEMLQASNEQHAKTVTDGRLERMKNAEAVNQLSVINESRLASRNEYLESREKMREIRRIKKQAHRSWGRIAAPVQKSYVDVNAEKDKDKVICAFIVKADVTGSLEAVEDSISNLNCRHAYCRIIKSETPIGSPTDSDLALAEISGATILCFNVKVDNAIAGKAQRAGVTIASHKVIYRLINYVTETLQKAAGPIITKEQVGAAEVRSIFKISLKSGQTMQVAGCRINSGNIRKTYTVELVRSGSIVYEGTLETLKQGKSEAEEVGTGSECGLTLKGWTEFKEGDILNFFSVKETYED